MSDPAETIVRHYRQILMWPLHLVEARGSPRVRHWWELFAAAQPAGPWQRREQASAGPDAQAVARRYAEFVTFLPQVRRFLYGQGRSPTARVGYGESPMRVFEREDVAAVEVRLDDDRSVTLDVQACRLVFFYDVDIVIFVVELAADDLPLSHTVDLQHRLGRVFPARWDENGHAVHCPRELRWLSADGSELARSDFDDAAKYMQAVNTRRAAAIASHWAQLMRPMVLHFSPDEGLVRYRQLEYQRMPHLLYLSVDDPFALAQADHVRLGLGLGTGAEQATDESSLQAFAAEHAYDALWSPGSRRPGLSTRVLCNGHSLTLIGSARNSHYADPARGVRADFSHQTAWLALIAHFHRAALLVQSDRHVMAVSQLDPQDPRSVAVFKRRTRASLESFLRFNHRYWFRELTNQPTGRAVFAMMRRHLALDGLFDEVRQEVLDMSQYLDSDDARHQSESVLRLTVVTIFGMVGTIVTGFLGMNLFAAADWPATHRVLFFLVVLLPSLLLTLLTVRHSRQLSALLDRIGRDPRESVRARTARLARQAGDAENEF